MSHYDANPLDGLRAAGKEYEVGAAKFAEFIRHVREMQVPTLKFDEPSESEFGFTFLGVRHRLRYVFQWSAHERGTKEIVHSMQTSPDEETYTPDRSVVFDDLGNVKPKGSKDWPWTISRSAAEIFLYLLEGTGPAHRR